MILDDWSMISVVLIKGTQKEWVRREVDVMMEAEIKVIRPQDKEWWQPLEVGRGKEQILPRAFRETSSADSLV